MNRIGPYEMLKLSQLPTVAGGVWERRVRPGIQGVALWHQARVADILELESHAPTVSLAAAQALYRSYVTLTFPTAPPVPIIFANQQHPGMLYKVLHVAPVPGQVHALVRGHFAGEATNYQGWLCCRWTVQPIQRN